MIVTRPRKIKESAQTKHRCHPWSSAPYSHRQVPRWNQKKKCISSENPSTSASDQLWTIHKSYANYGLCWCLPVFSNISQTCPLPVPSNNQYINWWVYILIIFTCLVLISIKRGTQIYFLPCVQSSSLLVKKRREFWIKWFLKKQMSESDKIIT